ncbi:MAG: rhodanese-like domain-containing protein [Rhodobacteraceae bacterium]|nr:rhodanese-like domain-containing protein [Paracoccaceae bacterium]
MDMKISAEQLVARANAEIVTIPVKEAMAAQDSGRFVMVDLRDIRELTREGQIPGAVHAPRGMLEFWVDPDCIYHRAVFAQPDKTFVFYCASAWRSALAAKAIQDMGMENVAHLQGGFSAWKQQGGPVEEKKKR